MKKFRFLLTLVVLIFSPFLVMGQTEGGATLIDPSGYLATFALYITSLLLVVEFVISMVKSENYRKVIIWVVAIVLGILGFVFKLGIFYTTWYVGLLYILMGGAVAIGYLTAEQGQMLIDIIKSIFKSKETLKAEAREREIKLIKKNQQDYSK